MHSPSSWWSSTSFRYEKVLNFIKWFLHQWMWSCDFSSLGSEYSRFVTKWWICSPHDGVSNIEPAYLYRKPHFGVYNSFSYADSTCYYFDFVQVFLHIISGGMLICGFLPCTSFVWSQYKGHTSFIKWIWRFSPLLFSGGDCIEFVLTLSTFCKIL